MSDLRSRTRFRPVRTAGGAVAWGLTLGALARPAEVHAHEFQVHTVVPSPDWCEEVHRVAEPGDVIQLLSGTYPGGCDLTTGGDIEDNEALGVQGDPAGGTVLDADATGLSLRISGEPTRLYLVTALGTVHVAASGVTIDRSDVACLEVDAGLPKVTIVFSTIDDLDLDVGSAVLRANQLGTVNVVADEGRVLDNTVHERLSTTVPAERNLVLGDLEAGSDATGNIVMGRTTAEGPLLHNTLLGEVVWNGPASNNLTVTTELPEEGRNVRCADCLLDASRLDLQPTGAALTVAPAPTAPAAEDFCGQLPEYVGAVGTVGEGWTAHDRDVFGCAPGLAPTPPPAPEGWCAVADPVDTAPLDTAAPTTGVQLADGPSGCQTARVSGWPPLFARRRTP